MALPGVSRENDDVLVALDQLVAVGRANIDTWAAVMERVERTHRLRADGTPYRDMRLEGDGDTIVSMIAASQQRLTDAAAAFRRALAAALVAEGMSQAEVARVFGVSRQRIAALLDHGTAGAPAANLRPGLDPPAGPAAAPPA